MAGAGHRAAAAAGAAQRRPPAEAAALSEEQKQLKTYGLDAPDPESSFYAKQKHEKGSPHMYGAQGSFASKSGLPRAPSASA